MIEIIFNNILPFIVILTILVFVHELGHYLAAIKNNVKVEVFSIGFGKELFGFDDKNGTRWKFSLIPLGGYVKMHGDLDVASTKTDDKNVNKHFSFYNKSNLQRSIILFAGPLANFLFSLLVLIFINCYFGFSENRPVISEIEDGQPADLSGLKVGDEILEINDKRIPDFISLKQIILDNNNSIVNVTYLRNGNVDKLKINITDNKIGIKGTIYKKKLYPFLGLKIHINYSNEVYDFNQTDSDSF